MAQPGSALVWGTSGRWFKSSRPDQVIDMKSNKEISIVIFKRNSGKSFSLNISSRKLQFFISGLVLAFITLGVGIYLSYNTNIQQVAYNQLKKEHFKQTQELKVLTDELDFFQNNLNHLIEKEEELAQLLGKAVIKKKN